MYSEITLQARLVTDLCSVWHDRRRFPSRDHSFLFRDVNICMHHPDTKMLTIFVHFWVGAHVLCLNIYEVKRARKLCWIDVNVKNRKGVLMCPSGSTFHGAYRAVCAQDGTLRICRTNVRAEGLGAQEVGLWPVINPVMSGTTQGRIYIKWPILKGKNRWSLQLHMARRA